MLAAKLKVTSMGIAFGIVWGVGVLAVSLGNMFYPDYGVAFLNMVSSVYPGYEVAGTPRSVAIGTLYAALDGLIVGIVLAWVYNVCTPCSEGREVTH